MESVTIETLRKQHGKLIEINFSEEGDAVTRSLILRKPNIKELDMYYALTKANQPNRAAQALITACAVSVSPDMDLNDVEIIGAAITPLMNLINGVTATVKKH